MKRADCNFALKVKPIISKDIYESHDYQNHISHIMKSFAYERLHVTIMCTFKCYAPFFKEYIEYIKNMAPIEFKLVEICKRNHRVIILQCLNDDFNDFCSNLRKTQLRGAQSRELKKQKFFPAENNFHILFSKEDDTQLIIKYVDKLIVDRIFFKPLGRGKMIFNEIVNN